MLLSASLVINGYAANANTVHTASDLQERMLNEQNDEANGIGISSPTATAVIRSANDARQHRQDQFRALLRGSSLEADSMASMMSMSMPNTVSTMDMDDIDIINDDETENNYKLSVESEKVSGVSNEAALNFDVNEITKKFEHQQHLSLESKCDALRHVFSLQPAFKKGKFEHLLKLVCPKEQTTSTSTTSTGQTSTEATTTGQTSTSSTSTTFVCPTLPGGFCSESTTGSFGLGLGFICLDDTECFDCELFLSFQPFESL